RHGALGWGSSTSCVGSLHRIVTEGPWPIRIGPWRPCRRGGMAPAFPPRMDTPRAARSAATLADLGDGPLVPSFSEGEEGPRRRFRPRLPRRRVLLAVAAPAVLVALVGWFETSRSWAQSHALNRLARSSSWTVSVARSPE